MANDLSFLSIGLYRIRFVRIFDGFTTEGATNRSGAAKMGNVSLNAASFLKYRYLEMWRFVI